MDRVGYKPYTDKFFSFPDSFVNLHKRSSICYGTVKRNHKGMPKGFDSKHLNWNWVTYRISHTLDSEVSWLLCFGKTCDMCTYWQVCINHQHMSTSVLNTGEIINPPLLKTIVVTWAAITNGTGWSLPLQLENIKLKKEIIC